MKNLLLPKLLFVFLVLFSSCSGNDDAPVNPTIDDDNLVTQAKTVNSINEVIYFNGQIDSQSIINFNYENNVLVSLDDNNASRVEFVYDGNKIVEIKNFINDNYEQSVFNTYENNLLTKIDNPDNESYVEFIYQNTVLSSKTIRYNNNGNWVVLQRTNYVFDNENIFQTVTQASGSSFKTTHEYDDKNTIFKGMNPYLKLIFEFESVNPLTKNNRLKSFRYENVNSNEGTQSHEYVITYDVDNYPTNIKKYNFDGVRQELISEMNVTYN